MAKKVNPEHDTTVKETGVKLAKGEQIDLLNDLKADAWLSAWGSVLQRTNRIVTGERITVQVGLPGEQINGVHQVVPDGIPSWTDGLNIYINRDEMRTVIKGSDSVTAALRLKGLNYHELSHVLYTPRAGSPVLTSVMKKAEQDDLWLYAYQTLEDQRIETWFTAMYGASQRYFESNVMEWILKNGTSESAIQLYGRKYLTPKIRVRVGQAFVARFGQALYEEFKTIIDSYLTVTLPGEDQKALSLIGRFHTLLTELMQKHGATLPPLLIADNGGGGQHGGHGSGHSGNGAGRTDQSQQGNVSKRAAQEARKAAMDAIEDALDADAEFEQDEANGGQDGDGADAAGGTSNGAGTSSSGAKDAMSQLLSDAAEAQDDIKQDQDIKQDAERTMDAVAAVVNNSDMLDLAPAQKSGQSQPAPQAALLAMRRTHDVLARIRSAAEPETLFRQVHGRMDGRRLANRQPHEVDLFRTYNSGREDEVGVEGVVLVDISGSMSHRMADTSMAVWALKRAMDKLDIPTTVILFDTPGGTRIAYKGREKAPANIPTYGSGGGTTPTEALEAAAKVFYKSTAVNKVLITITDGSWSGAYDNGRSTDPYLPIMKAIKKMNVSSLLLGLDDAVKNYGAHHHDHGYDMNNIGDLPKAATRLVAGLMQKADLM